MHFLKKPLHLLLFFILAFSSLVGKEDHRIEPQPAALERAAELPCKGILKQSDNGFAYLDISNSFILDIVPLLEMEGELRPPPTATRSLGAHISVFHEDEKVAPKELGKSYSFSVREIRSFTLHTRDGLKKLWVIAVDAPELEQLRQSYGLAPKMKGFEYHITLGKQMPAGQEGWEGVEELSPLNFSDEPAEGLFSEGDFVVVNNEELLATAAKVDAIGQLKLKNNGFVYVDVSNDYIDEIVGQLPLQGSFSPVSTSTKKMGAHISVIYEDEMIGKEIWNLAEAGQWFTFEVKELRTIDRGSARLWVLAVEAPALERLRKQYGLKPKLQGHDFHITIGTEQLGSRAAAEELEPAEAA